MRRAWLVVLALPVALVPAAALVVAANPAGAASCKVMTVGYAFASGTVIAIQPDHQDIAYDGCVQFTNNLDLDATITVTGGYSVTLGPKESTPPKDAYVGTTAGQHAVKARSGPSSADGSITVGAPPESPKPTHSPTPVRTTPPPKSSAPHPSSSSGTGPRIAPVPPRVGGSVPQHRRPSPPGPPPSVAPTPLGATPTPSPTPSRREPAVVAVRIEPPSGRGAGLPGALAALAIVGTAAGLVRVLLAEPVGAVDGRIRSVGGTP